jgi:hypothetical protein
VKLTTHLQLVPRSRKCGSIHPLPYTSAWRNAEFGKHRDNFTFTFIPSFFHFMSVGILTSLSAGVLASLSAGILASLSGGILTSLSTGILASLSCIAIIVRLHDGSGNCLFNCALLLEHHCFFSCCFNCAYTVFNSD